MADINTIMLCGRLGADPELRQTNNGKAVATFNLATGRKVRAASGDWDEVTEWHKVVCWETLAEQAGKRLNKGDKVFVSGELRYGNWTDKEGQKRVSSEVVARRWDLVVKKLSTSSSADQPLTSSPDSSVADAEVPF